MNDEYDFVQPWAPEAEAGVIGALLLDNNAFDNVADLITADSFFDERAGHMFAAISRMVLEGKPADVLTVTEAVSQFGISLQLVNQFSQSAATPRHARSYAETIAEKSLSRRLLGVADDVKAVAFDFNQPINERIGAAQGLIEGLQNKAVKGRPKAIQDYVAGAIEKMQDLADGKIEPGIKTRIPFVDRALGGGLKPGKLIILAARPSVGKSSFAEQICINVAQDGSPAAMFSMEMTGQEMTERAVCCIGGIDMERYSTGKLEEREWGYMGEAVEKIRNLPLFFDDQPALTVQEIAAKARILVRKNGIKLLVIDYIQLCGVNAKKESRHHQIEEISRGLKTLAKQLNITIMALSQLNRDVTKRASGRPQLSDLKESGAIEEDADVVMLMWEAQKFDDYQLNGLELAKVRGGKKGICALHFQGNFQRWSESTQSLETSPKSSYGGNL